MSVSSENGKEIVRNTQGQERRTAKVPDLEFDGFVLNSLHVEANRYREAESDILAQCIQSAAVGLARGCSTRTLRASEMMYALGIVDTTSPIYPEESSISTPECIRAGWRAK